MKNETRSIHRPQKGILMPQRELVMTYSRVMCCDIALYALETQLVKSTRQRRFQCLSSHQVNALRQWLLSHQCPRRSCRFDDRDSVVWTICDSEVAYWLWMALQFGITEDVLLNLAIDEANYEHDMRMLDTHGDFDEALSNQALCDSYQALHHYYCRALTHKTALITQLECLLKSFKISMNQTYH